MSAGSRKKHSSNHKQFQGNADQLEVSSLIAGAGNGRDVKERLDKAIEGVENLPTNEQGLVNADDLVKAGNELNAALKEVSTPSPPNDGVMGGVPGIGNEGPVSAGNADTPNNEEGNNMSRIGDAIMKDGLPPRDTKVELDLSRSSATPGYAPDLERWLTNQPFYQPNLIAVVTRGVKEELFHPQFMPTIKSMIELQALSITGLKTGFTVLGGEVCLHESEAIFQMQERYGRVIDRTLHLWGQRYQDYLTQQTAKATMTASQKKKAMTLDDVTIDVVFFEIDKTHTAIARAWLGTNLHVGRYPGIQSQRDLTAGQREVFVEFSLEGKYTHNEHAEAVAKAELDKLGTLAENPYVAQIVTTE
jgi:hypothetical protein